MTENAELVVFGGDSNKNGQDIYSWTSTVGHCFLGENSISFKPEKEANPATTICQQD